MKCDACGTRSAAVWLRLEGGRELCAPCWRNGAPARAKQPRRVERPAPQAELEVRR